MNRYLIILLSLSLCFLSSCLNIIEELQLKKNGSGKYMLTFDMSPMLEEEFTKNMLQQMLEEQSARNGLPLSSMEIDTILYFKDRTEKEKAWLDNPEFWDGVLLHVNMSDRKKILTAKMEFEFETVEDISYFYDHLDEISASIDNSKKTREALAPSQVAFELNKRTLKRLPGKEMATIFAGEELEFAKTFFAKASYKMIYTLPGKIKKTSLLGAKIKGNSLQVKHSMLDVLDEKVYLNGDIKFKSK